MEGKRNKKMMKKCKSLSQSWWFVFASIGKSFWRSYSIEQINHMLCVYKPHTFTHALISKRQSRWEDEREREMRTWEKQVIFEIGSRKSFVFSSKLFHFVFYFLFYFCTCIEVVATHFDTKKSSAHSFRFIEVESIHENAGEHWKFLRIAIKKENSFSHFIRFWPGIFIQTKHSQSFSQSMESCEWMLQNTNDIDLLHTMRDTTLRTNEWTFFFLYFFPLCVSLFCFDKR